MDSVHVQTKVNIAAVAFATLILIAAFPLIGLMALTLRALLLMGLTVAVMAGVCCLIACPFSPTIRAWFSALARPIIQYKGFRLATDVSFHPGHSWARTQGDVCVGVDDVAQTALGPVDCVELPPRGRHVRQGEPLLRLWHGDRVLDVPSPVSGTVLSSNSELRVHPELINNQPFAEGWAVKMKGENLRNEKKLLLRGRKARAWFQSSADRIALIAPQQAAASESPSSAPYGQLHRRIDDQQWRQLAQTMFGVTQRPAE
ncbi:MAG: glycine cleavage system protein H [Phycisphaerales bacterium]|nr:glycine cleavage system protein H [Phycisphaerales bacterium]